MMRRAAQLQFEMRLTCPHSWRSFRARRLATQPGLMGPAGRGHTTGKLRLDAGQPRATAAHLWASLVARLLALLLLCSVTCAAAAMGDAAVRPSARACGTPAWPAWPQRLAPCCSATKKE